MSDRAHLRAVAHAPGGRRSAAPFAVARPAAAGAQRRRRRAAGLLRFAVFLLLIFIAVWAGVRVAHAGADGAIYSGQHYRSTMGDDLWMIAADEYGAGIDLRRAVYAIKEANRLKSSSLQPGQGLTLPYLDE